ncbi:MAG: outer membrane protein [Candidatus Binatia bacterium]|jgi:outer membrane protein
MYKRFICLTAAAFFCFSANGAELDSSKLKRRSPLTLKEFLQKVLERNEEIQGQMLETEIGRQNIKIQKGVFTPSFVSDFEFVDSRRANTVEQQANLGLFASNVFNQRNKALNNGVEWTIATGGQLRLGQGIQQLKNNVNGAGFPGGEYVSNIGLSITQPILKNFGKRATMANIRLAAAASDVAFEGYRKALIELVATAEASYWDLYLTQEQYRISEESVELARSVLKDSEERVRVGKASELEVLQAQAGLSTRQALQNEALQRALEANNRANTLYGASSLQAATIVSPTDTPTVQILSMDLQDHWLDAFDMNPDFKLRKIEAGQEDIRLAYAKNQRLPQLDLRASYGLNGLGGAYQSSFDQLYAADFPAWTVGFEFRIPLDGGRQGKRQLEVAKLRAKQALLNIKQTESQLINGIDTSLEKVRTFSSNINSYQTVVNFNQKVLDSELTRLEVGRTTSRAVLEAEEDLFEAKVSYVQGLVQYERSLLELESIKGSLLRNRSLELSKEQLAETTAGLVNRANLSPTEIRQVLGNLKTQYKSRGSEHGFGARDIDRAARTLQLERQKRTPDSPMPASSSPQATPKAPAAQPAPAGGDAPRKIEQVPPPATEVKTAPQTAPQPEPGSANRTSPQWLRDAISGNTGPKPKPGSVSPAPKAPAP